MEKIERKLKGFLFTYQLHDWGHYKMEITYEEEVERLMCMGCDDCYNQARRNVERNQTRRLIVELRVTKNGEFVAVRYSKLLLAINIEKDTLNYLMQDINEDEIWKSLEMKKYSSR